MKASSKYMSAIALILFIVVFNSIIIRSNANYDIHNDLYIPKGGEFSFGEFNYRVVKQETRNRRGELEITGYNPSYDENTDDGEFIGDYHYDIVGIADNAFKGNQYIRMFRFPGVHFRYIGKSAFEGCTNLRYFESNRDGLVKIKSRAFYGCRSLKKIHLVHNNLRYVGKNAFRDTNPRLKIITWNMSKEYIPKVKKLLKKAGAKKITFKMHFFNEEVEYDDPCH